jgi:hypothetical protein
MQESFHDSPFSCIETLDNTEYLWILYQSCFQSAGLNVQVPTITIPPPLSFEPMAPWTFSPASRHPGMRICCILYLIFNQYYQKLALIPWSIKSMCSITLHRPLWEHLVNGRVGRRTHLFKGSSTTLQTVVDITWTIPRLRDMRKSW